ncbi:MAG: ATP-binding protein [Gemmatimonadota bacterium]|nr:ATP-binding protein [Gemmatimonadota bacterium]
MTFRQKLLFGVFLLILPSVVIGLGAVRSNRIERDAIAALETRLARSRTYAELETAMFDQSVLVWQILGGVDSGAIREVPLRRQVVEFRFAQWQSQLDSQDLVLATAVSALQRQFEAVTDSVLALMAAGRRADGYRLARTELSAGLEPALTALNRDIYRRTRESTVAGAFQSVAGSFERERRFLLAVLVVSSAGALLAALLLAENLIRPIHRLQEAIAAVGAGDLDHPLRSEARDEIGDLARAFSGMTGRLRESRTELVRLNHELEGKIEQLEQAQAQLIQSEKLASLGQVATGVAHGLRNPLASIRASAQLLATHPGSTAAPEHLRGLIAEVDRLDRRITHLLDFARPASLRLTSEKVATLVEDVLPAFAERARSQQVAVQVTIPPALPTVRMDALRTEQALVEVISNAFDAMPSGGTLSIGAHPSNGGGQTPGVVVEVRDTGPGIPLSIQPSVGQPFFSTRPEGTGLGVATARRFVEQGGGRLEITSAPPGGTTVRLWLPVAP